MKKVFVSGGTHGIGKATVEKLIKDNWEVYSCASKKDDPMGREMEKLYPNFHFRYADVSSEIDVKNFFCWCGPIEAAFNNAGIGCKPAAPHLLDAGAAKRILEVNLLGTALCMKYECEAMLKGTGGVIVNSSSVSAYKAATGADAIYSASKAGILRLTEEAAVREEYRGKIRFFTLVPGWIETRMTAADDQEAWKRMLPSRAVGKPEDVARLVVEILGHAEVFDSGHTFHLNGGGILV